MRRDRRGGRRDARDAGRPGGRRRDGGGAPAPTTRTSALGSHPGAAAGDVAGGPRGRGATTLRERHQGRGALAGGDRMTWAGGTTRAPSAPASRPPGGTSGGSPTGAARGGGNAPDGGPAAAAIGPSRQCRCRGGPLWGVTEAPGYAGGSLLASDSLIYSLKGSLFTSDHLPAAVLP